MAADATIYHPRRLNIPRGPGAAKKERPGDRPSLPYARRLKRELEVHPAAARSKSAVADFDHFNEVAAFGWISLEIHPAAATGHRGHGVLLLRQFRDHGFGGDEEPRHRGRALQRLAHDLGRVDDALLHHVDIV